MTTVIDTTVSRGFCVGCGVCAGTCPNHVLKMEFNEYGEYNPVKLIACPHECGICVKVCPFADGNDNEDILGHQHFGDIPQINHSPELGYYLSVGAGAVSSEERRLRSSSGGLASWFLEECLNKGIVDAVICVGHSTKHDRLFEFHVATTLEDIRESAGSAYYPVELSEMIHFVQSHPGKYAIIGLPCFLKGVRLAQNRSKILRERIVVTVGLACCNLKNVHFTKYAAWASGIRSDLSYVSYRDKSTKLPRNYYNFHFVDVHGNTSELKWSRGELWEMYNGRFCSLHSCDCCDDMFAECADVIFMDAWLTRYNKEPCGTNLWISRSHLVNELIDAGRSDGSLIIDKVSVDDVIASQNTLRWKREVLKYRLLLLGENGEMYPRKRVSPGYGNTSFIEREECRRYLQIQEESRELCSSNRDYSCWGEWFRERYNAPFGYRVISTVIRYIRYLRNIIMDK